MSKHFEALSGWYKLMYPEDWQFEVDPEGRYNFYNPNMGIGVLKISSFVASDEERILETDLKEQCTPPPTEKSLENSVYFAKESKDKQCDLHFWITEWKQIKLFCTYTVDKFMANDSAAREELHTVSDILSTVRFN